MPVLEQPFLTRREILAVLRPGQITTERPFQTLRQRRVASPGLRVPLRGMSGQVMGGLRLYSTLNADAARAFRLARTEQANEYAARAQQLEASEPAAYLRDLIDVAAQRVYADPDRDDALKGYLRRRHHGWAGLDSEAVTREWLTHADAWLPSVADTGKVADALTALWEEASKARVEVDGSTELSVSTFLGVVTRMDATAAELQGDNQDVVLVPRDELEREGLASLGQAVALLCEALPGGGTYMLPRAAVALGEAPPFDEASPYDFDYSRGGFPVDKLDPADAAWLERELAREPKAVPLAPLPVREN